MDLTVNSLKTKVLEGIRNASDALFVGSITLDRALDQFIIEDPEAHARRALQDIEQARASLGVVDAFHTHSLSTPPPLSGHTISPSTIWNHIVGDVQRAIMFNVSQPLLTISLKLSDEGFH